MSQTAMEVLQQLIVIQNQFVGQDLIHFMRENIDIPVIIVTLYLALVLYVPNAIMKDRKPIPCKAFFTLWNLILTIFSAIGSYYTVPHLVNMVWTQGIRQSACNATYFFDGPVGFWMGMFALSKVPELMDTVFLVIQKKDIIFLHWFHHATVMLFCWSAYSNRVAAGLWFAAMNFIVHSIMYFYYFLTACGARAIVRPFAPLITSLQLLQMVVGMVVTVATFVWRRDEEGCSVDPTNARLGLIMYASYFVLFAMLFKKSYLTPGGRKGRTQKTDTVDAKTK